MIGQQEEATLKGAVLNLAKGVAELKEMVNSIANAQEEVDSSLQELARAKKTEIPIQVMDLETVEETVEETVRNTLKFVLDKLTFSVSLNDKNIARINNFLTAAEDLVESNKSIRPRRSLMNINIRDGKFFFWIGLAVAGVGLSVATLVFLKCSMIVESIKDQPIYWGDRAYQAARLLDEGRPGDTYHMVVSNLSNEPDKMKEYVNALETESVIYQEIKTALRSLLGKKDKRDIRIINWEVDKGEYWILYRFFDEEIERSVHCWPDGKVEETTDTIVKDLATAQKYSTRKIWTVIQEASVTR